MDQVEKRFCLSASPDSLLQSQHWLGAKVQFSSFILSVNNGGNFTGTWCLSHFYIPVPSEVYCLFSRFLCINTRQCRFLCTRFFWCSKFPFVLFFCFSSLDRGFCTFSAWTNHNMIEAVLAMPKVQPKVPAQPPASGVGRASPGATGQEKVLLITFRIIVDP